MRILYLPNSKCQQRQHEKPNNLIYPVRLAMEAQYYRNLGHNVVWDSNAQGVYDKIVIKEEGLPFLSLPKPDRIWTRAMDSKYQMNGNFKYKPGTYIQAASGCWWGKCRFCVEQGQKLEVRTVDDVIDEIKECSQLGFREVFDDSATFPTDLWLHHFCFRMTTLRLPVTLGCNMRMVDTDYEYMKYAGFRMVLFGVESANQRTLDRINKRVKCEDVKYIIKASKCGLEPHVAVIFGFPWETDAEAVNTLRLVHYLLRKGFAKTAQASFYDTQETQGNGNHRKLVRRLYRIAYSPEFWFNQLKNIKDVNDIKYLWRKIKSAF